VYIKAGAAGKSGKAEFHGPGETIGPGTFIIEAAAARARQTRRADGPPGAKVMKKLLVLVALVLGSTLMAADKTIYDFTLNSIDGQPTPLSTFKGKVVLLVNVASRCGYTPQYTALESLYEKYKDQGFVIVGIPANNFGQQEPGSNAEIKTFCTSKYNVKFPMMAKVSVKGSDITPLYAYLTDKSVFPNTGGEIGWNFTKFLVGRDGQVITRFDSKVTPDSPEVTSAVEKALAK
jgi:glutathione peroxidase